MAKLFIAAAALLAATANAFAPNALPPASVSNHASPLVLGMAVEESGSKRKRALKTLAKTAGVLSSVAFATAGLPPAAIAAKKAKEVVEVVETVDNTKKILAAGAALIAGGAAFAKLSATEATQDFLEASPYWDQSNVPVNVYKNKAPFTGKVVSTKRIVGPQATGETCHIIIDHKGDFPYWEGQSWGVIPPGTREKDGKPHSVRLYSIASSRYGDDKTGNTGSLCVRRATYWCPELKAEDPAKKGICSNFLCDTKPGDEVMMTGPAGKVMLMPEEDPKTDYIMVATGQAWLFLGVANSDALLYDDEFQEAKSKFPDNFRLDYALSREQNNKKGGKMYIQDKVEEYADEIFDKLSKGAHIYFCGLKGMMPGIQDMLADVCKAKGLDYDEFIKGLKEKKQWHVEVY
ncbi:hypothetical protein HJC23_010627 [Cyclotella cryptica]|uniref:ferredoxin--NADP(+) reductase n=1 Tax=Cyclotella cryptica TaxID=29204 RepID=A0ABD3NKE2_9STRA